MHTRKFQLFSERTRLGRLIACLGVFGLAARVLAGEVSGPLAEQVVALAALPTGQHVAADRQALAWFNEDGTLDASLGLSRVTYLGLDDDSAVLATESRAVQRVNVSGKMEVVLSRDVQPFLTQPDGKVVTWERNAILRRNSDGTIDPTFQSNNIPMASSPLPVRGALALQSDGKIIVGATFEGKMVRLNADGTLDPAFNAQRLDQGTVQAIAVQPDGKIIIGGRFMKIGDQARGSLARLNADGSLDRGYAPATAGTTTVSSLALQADGKLLVSGWFEQMGGEASTNLARLTSDGALDRTFPIGLVERVPLRPFSAVPMVLTGEGDVVFGYTNRVVKADNPEAATQSFSQDGTTLTWLRGGSAPEITHAKFYSSLDGVTWTELGLGARIAGGWKLEGASVQPGSRYRMRGYVTGSSSHLEYVPGAPAILAQPFDRTNAVNTDAAFRVFAAGAEPLQFQWLVNGAPIVGATSSRLLLNDVNGGNAGGYSVIVSNAEGASTSRVASLTVRDPIIHNQPTWAWVNAGDTLSLSVAAEGTGLRYQWMFNGEPISGATDATLVIRNADPRHTGNYKVAVRGTYGVLESAVVIARVNKTSPAEWKPLYEPSSEWFPIQGGAVHNDDLFLGGLFRLLPPPAPRHLAHFRPDDSLNESFAPQPSGGPAEGVTAVAVSRDGTVLVGGNFLSIGGQAQPYLARLTRGGAIDTSFKPVINGTMGGLFTQVTGMEVQPDGRLLISGNFASVNGMNRPGVARLFPDGNLDESFNPAASSVPASSWNVLLQADGKVIVYGWSVSRVNADGSADASFRPPSGGASKLLLLPNQQILGSFLDAVRLLNPDGSVVRTYPVGMGGGLQGLQADGKILVRAVLHAPEAASQATGISAPIHALLRLNPDGTEDPAFSAALNEFGTVKAMRRDGSLIVAGGFTSASGKPSGPLMRLVNTEPAHDLLTLEGDSLLWMRSGTSREVNWTAFEFSANGSDWAPLGFGTRTAGGWKLENTNISGVGTVRALGFAHGSLYESRLDVPVRPRIESLAFRAEHRELTVTAKAFSGSMVVFEVSGDLKQWRPVQTNTLSTRSTLQLNLTNMNAAKAFYRLRQINN